MIEQTIFTIAKHTSETYGHGDAGVETRICHEGAYGSGKFPPCFLTWKEAEEYRKEMKYNSDTEVVELQLMQSI